MKAIILMSGGLDSAVILAIALKQKRECLVLSFDYGQRHKIELESAKKITAFYNVPHKIITIDPKSFGNSSLLSSTSKSEFEVPKNRTVAEMKQAETPNTYVPARNTIFLSFAIAQAEIFQAGEIYIGPNALDMKYPDCSQEFIDAFQQVINVATAQAVSGNAPKLVAPLLKLNKAEIIALGLSLKAPLEMTFSCYDPIEGQPCLECDACSLRKTGFLASSSSSQNSSTGIY